MDMILSSQPRGHVIIHQARASDRNFMRLPCARTLDITLMPLPGYSPDLMPVEALWRWLREDVTDHHCHASAMPARRI